MKKQVKWFAIFAALLLIACGPSKLQIQEMSSERDILIEVRYVENDSIGYFVGNTLFLNTRQFSGDSLFPLLVSTRNPANIDIPTATDVISDSKALTAYLSKNAPSLNHFGFVVSHTAALDIDFDEKKAIQMILNYIDTFKGASLVFFREKDGDLTHAKKVR